ncbi:MAG: aspartate aminotransferase family protein [Alphaproteobacteria bacterium]|nr:aspartate aminotransferase family protein [Alphaproteobacteria bacterium]
MAMPNVNFFEAGKADLTPKEKEIIARRERLLGPAYRLSYQHPLHIVRGEGVWLYDAGGKTYLDAYNNVPCVGHCHPHVIAALAKQASTLNVHTRYMHEAVLDYAEKLLATFPAELGHVMFTCSGSEANDLACRFAEVYTGGTGFIATELAYHGGTKVAAEISPSLGGFAKNAPHVRLIPAPDAYRAQGQDVGAVFAAHVQRAIQDMQAHGIRPAALIVDTIFASDGVFADPPGFLTQAAEVIRKAGGLFIADEVQAGFGRTGEQMWGFERHGLVPDIATMGKPMGAGYPMAGLAIKPEIVKGFSSQSRYFNTFGGTPVAAAVGLAVLEVIEREQLMENVSAVGHHLRQGLKKLAIKHPLIGDVRGAGLYIAAELVRDRKTLEPATAETERVVNSLREKRVLISSAGISSNILKIRPPLTFSKDNADLLLAKLDEALAAL